MFDFGWKAEGEGFDMDKPPRRITPAVHFIWLLPLGCWGWVKVFQFFGIM